MQQFWRSKNMSSPIRGQGSHAVFRIALKSNNTSYLHDPYRSICVKFGDWECNGSEEVGIVKSLQTDSRQDTFNRKSSTETLAEAS